ncbi:MAG: DUF3592 domain-containing protein [Firmicutes bacterium]|nr:DUF3592 domain-containing protein [Bacillota bacterium]
MDNNVTQWDIDRYQIPMRKNGRPADVWTKREMRTSFIMVMVLTIFAAGLIAGGFILSHFMTRYSERTEGRVVSIVREDRPQWNEFRLDIRIEYDVDGETFVHEMSTLFNRNHNWFLNNLGGAEVLDDDGNVLIYGTFTVWFRPNDPRHSSLDEPMGLVGLALWIPGGLLGAAAVWVWILTLKPVFGGRVVSNETKEIHAAAVAQWREKNT